MQKFILLKNVFTDFTSEKMKLTYFRVCSTEDISAEYVFIGLQLRSCKTSLVYITKGIFY